MYAYTDLILSIDEMSSILAMALGPVSILSLMLL